MRKKVLFLLIPVLALAFALAGCGNTTTNNRANTAIADAKAALADAKAKGVQIPADEQKLITDAQSNLKSDTVEALVLATEAKADIKNDLKDAFNVAEQTYNVSRGTAEGIVAGAPAGSDLAQAKQSLQNAEAKKAAATTVGDWYSPTDGPIYWANLAARQAAVAATAQAASQAAAAELQKRVEQGSIQMNRLMSNWLLTKGYNPADYKLGIQKISAKDISWATGAATLLAPMPGSQPISFLFNYENGTWVLKAAPTWTVSQFGAPSDMVP